jgi:hypothetical protein
VERGYTSSHSRQHARTTHHYVPRVAKVNRRRAGVKRLGDERDLFPNSETTLACVCVRGQVGEGKASDDTHEQTHDNTRSHLRVDSAMAARVARQLMRQRERQRLR